MDADKILAEIGSEKEFNDTLHLLTPELYGQMSDGRLCLIMNKNAVKFNAITKLSECWNIPISEIVSFGDDYNDIEMIRNSGTGVAMGNAIDEVKQVADAITDTNDNDGVAKYIEEFILNAQ